MKNSLTSRDVAPFAIGLAAAATIALASSRRNRTAEANPLGDEPLLTAEAAGLVTHADFKFRMFLHPLRLLRRLDAVAQVILLGVGFFIVATVVHLAIS